MDPQNTVPPTNPSPAPAPVSSPNGNDFASKLKDKKVVTYGIIGLVVIVVAIVLAIVLPKVFGVSQADYAEANSKMSDLSSSYNKIGSVYLSASSTQTEIDNGLDTIKTAANDFEDQFTAYGKLKAIKNDKDLKKLYDSANSQLPQFKDALEATTEAYSKILPAVSKFNDLGYDDAASKITALKDAFDGITGLKNQNNKDFVSKMSTLLGTYATLAKKVQAGRDDYTKYDSATTDKYYDTSSAITDAITDWQSNLDKITEKGEMKDKLSALSDAVFQKSLKK